MRDNDDGFPGLDKCVDLLQTAFSERRVSHRHGFVDDQNIRVDAHGHRETQPHIHAGRVLLHRRIDEFFEPGKFNDRIELFRHLVFAESQDRAAQVNIFPGR